MDRNEAITEIRTALKARSGKTWSVKGDRGTAWGWISINVPPSRLGCDQTHRRNGSHVDFCTVCNEMVPFDRADYDDVCPNHVCTDSCYRHYIPPTERRELAALLGLPHVHPQGVSIPDSTDYRIEFVARAKGLTPIRCGSPYWD